MFEQERGQVALAYALPGWGRQGLVELVQQELGTKIAFENDVNLAAIGEQWQGLGKGVENFVYLHLGTGVGMGMVLNGELYRGAPARRARSVTSRSPRPTCVTRRTVDAERSTWRRARPGSSRRRDGWGCRRRSPRRRCSRRPAAAIGRRAGSWPARRIGSPSRSWRSASVVDPELVILGGGIGSNGDLLLEPVGAGAPRPVAVPASRRGLHAAAGGDAVRLGLDGAAGGAGPVVRTRRGVRVIPDGAQDRRPVKERGDQGQWFRSRRRETNMKRWLIAMATFALVAAACTASGGERHTVGGRHGERRFARARHAGDVGRVDRSRAQAVQHDLRRLHGEVPLDHGEQHRWRERSEVPGRHQRGRPAGRRCSRSRSTAWASSARRARGRTSIRTSSRAAST